MKFNHKGFTVMEVTITILIMAMISIPLYYVLSDSARQAHIMAARDYIKQEGNKVFKILENDLSQAKRGSFTQEGDEISIKIRTREAEKETDNMLTKKIGEDPVLKYTYQKPVLRRYIIDGNVTKEWVVSKAIDSLDIQAPSPAEAQTAPGKLVINLVMKSNLVGIKDEEQPKYEQNKIIIVKEDATSINDPNWLDVGSVGGIFQTDGNLLKDLKEQFIALGNNFVGAWAGALGDIKGMTIDQLKDKINSLDLGDLKSSLADVKDSLAKLKNGLAETNKEISNLGWQALYKQMEVKVKKSWFGLKVTTNEEEVKKDSERKERLAQGVKDLLSGYKNKSEMNMEAVKAKAGSELTEEGLKALEGLYQGKESQFESISQLSAAQDLLSDRLSSLQ